MMAAITKSNRPQEFKKFFLYAVENMNLQEIDEEEAEELLTQRYYSKFEKLLESLYDNQPEISDDDEGQLKNDVEEIYGIIPKGLHHELALGICKDFELIATYLTANKDDRCIASMCLSYANGEIPMLSLKPATNSLEDAFKEFKTILTITMIRNTNKKNKEMDKQTINKLESTEKTELFSGYLTINQIKLEVKGLQKENVNWKNLRVNDENNFYYFSYGDYGFNCQYSFSFENERCYINIVFPNNIRYVKEHYLIENTWVQQRNFIKDMLNIDIANSKIIGIDISIEDFLEDSRYIAIMEKRPDFSVDFSDKLSESFKISDKKIRYSIYASEHSEEYFKEGISLKKGHDLFDRFDYTHFMYWDILPQLKYFVVQLRNRLSASN